MLGTEKAVGAYELPLDPLAEPDAPPLEPTFVDKHVPPRREHTTYFAAGTVVEGTLRSDRDVEIVGDFSGEIMSDGKITIHANTVSSIAARALELNGSTLTGDVIVDGDVLLDEGSSITGNVRAANLNSAGVIQGNLTVRDSVTLRKQARVTGDIKTVALSMDRGVKLNGRVDMSQQT